MATIIITDTNPAERRTYITLLGNYGHRLLEANDGVEALELARAELPDLIIADIIMPNMDGFTLARRVNADPLLAGTPIIFHTSNYDVSEIHQLAHASGVEYILRKSAEPHEIIRAVNKSLKKETMPIRLSQTGQLQRDHLEVLANKLYQKVSELEEANEQLRNLSLTDWLTGLNNRRGFMILATGLLRFARRSGYSLSLIYIDLDSLKQINDMFGHTSGDNAILQFSRILNETFRDSDIIGRVGGDEFVILVVDASESGLDSMLTYLQNNVDAYNQHPESKHKLAYSSGVIHMETNSTLTMEELLSQADQAMYLHKKNRKRSG